MHYSSFTAISGELMYTKDIIMFPSLLLRWAIFPWRWSLTFVALYFHMTGLSGIDFFTCTNRVRGSLFFSHGQQGESRAGCIDQIDEL